MLPPSRLGQDQASSRAVALTIIVLVFMVHAIDRGIVAVVLEPLRQEFGLDDAQAGIIGGLAYGVAYALACIPMGIMVDRLNRRNLLGAILATWSAMTLLGGLAQSFAGLVACRAAVGVAESGGGPASVSLISDMYRPDERARAFGMLFLGGGLGAAIAAVVGGWIAREFDWRMALICAGIPGLFVAALLFALVREPVRGASEGVIVGRAPDAGTLARFFVRQQSMKWIYVAIPAVGIAMSVVATWTIPFLMRRHGLDIAMAGLMLGLLMGPAMGIGSVMTGQIADRLGKHSPRRRIAFSAVSLVLTLPALWTAYTTDKLWLTVASLAAAQMLFTSFLAPIIGVITMLCRPDMRGAALSARDMLANFIGFGMGPFLAGVISAAIGGEAALQAAILITTVGGTVIGVGMLALAARTIDADVARANVAGIV